MAGVNRARLAKSLTLESADRALRKPCIFLSHISVDKASALAIGDYICEQGDLDIYLDIFDQNLQHAVQAGDPAAITRFIEHGLSQSTHLMCLYSEKTVRSWWVPYEIGYGKRADVVAVSSLKLKGAVKLPAYLEVAEMLLGTESLNRYLEKIRRELHKAFDSIQPGMEHLIEGTASPHPLDAHLDWNR